MRRFLVSLKPLGKSQIFWCALGAIICLIWMGTLREASHPDYADASQYIGSAVNLAKHGTINESLRETEATVEPGIAREPGYPILLSVILQFNDSIDQITAECLYNGGCGTEPYVLAKWTNRFLIVAAGFVMFFAVRQITGNSFAAIFGGMHIWLNHQAHKNHDYVISDPLALFLASILVLSIAWAWKRQNALAWVLPGISLMCLAFTKAVYIYFIPIVLVFGVVFVCCSKAAWRSSLAKLTIFILVTITPIFLWMDRNHEITGKYQFTDSRGGIALSTRVVFNDMDLIDYLAAFTYWTRGAGDGWAEDLFPEDVVKPFGWYEEDGYYLRGQHGFGERVNELVATKGLPRMAAQDVAEQELKDEILSHPIKHLVTTLPLIYRGIWADEFAVITFPAFLILLFYSLRQRNGLLIAVLLPSLFSLVFYAAFSLNVARYQMTALPGFSVAFAYFAVWLRNRITTWRARRSLSLEERP